LATTNRRDLRVDDGVKVVFFTQLIRAARVVVHGIGCTRMNRINFGCRTLEALRRLQSGSSREEQRTDEFRHD